MKLQGSAVQCVFVEGKEGGEESSSFDNVEKLFQMRVWERLRRPYC